MHAMIQGAQIPHFDAAYLGAAACYFAYLVADVAVSPASGRSPVLRTAPLTIGLVLHLAGLALRAHAISYFPLTNKFESFYAFAFCVFATLAFVQRSPSRLHRLVLFAVGAAFYAWTFRFPRGASYPPPLMITVWYPLHVPASFFSYALFASSAGAAIAVLLGNREPEVLRALDAHAFWGWCAFSLSMICGGAWGWVAWGAYFLWDPKVIWSVVLWLFYSAFVHLRHWPPGNRPKVKAALSLVGLAVLFVAYVGTSFFFRHGSHAFG